MSGLLARRLRVRRHRATTAHLCSIYPFQTASPLPGHGLLHGINVLAGGCPFRFDPFDAYQSGLITNPNMLIAGEPGVGKSATAKAFIYRSVGVLGRWVAIADPKGEYRPLADALGLTVIKLRPGGRERLNPLDPGPDAAAQAPDELARRQTTMVAALLGSVLRRDLTPIEDATVGWAIAQLARRDGAATLADVACLLANPTDDMAATARQPPDELARTVQAAYYGLGKLLDRSLRGMFDGPSTATVNWQGPGIVIDLSAVHHDPEALTLVMIAATAWLQAMLATHDGPRRLQVLDEAWALLGSERTSRYLQASWKLSRSYGVANLAVVHRLSDLRAQADDGTATAKVAMGLLADTQTRVIFRQSSDQVAEAAALLDLTTTEAALLSRLVKGRALWKVGGHTAVVEHLLSSFEQRLCDTDQHMTDSTA